MYLSFRVPVYTESDLESFTFQEISKDKKNTILNKLWREYLIISAWFLLLLSLSSFLYYYCNVEQCFPCFVLCLILFTFISSVYLWNLKRCKEDSMFCHCIKVTHKHTVEVRGTYRTGHLKFYPVTGYDAVSNYESFCYLSKKTYEECKVGDNIEIVKGLGRSPISDVII